jgi:hypothetical protein
VAYSTFSGTCQIVRFELFFVLKTVFWSKTQSQRKTEKTEQENKKEGVCLPDSIKVG